MRQIAGLDEAKKIMEMIGDPREISDGLQRFRQAAQALSSDHPRFISEYRDKWVAVHNHDVLSADTLPQLLETVDAKGINRDEIIVRFIDDAEKVFIL